MQEAQGFGRLQQVGSLCQGLVPQGFHAESILSVRYKAIDAGRSETIQNQLNPTYQKTFQLDFIFESRQDIRFDIFDDDGNGDNDDFIGTVETTVGALMGATSMTSILNIQNPKFNKADNGKLIIRCEKLEDSNGTKLLTQNISR